MTISGIAASDAGTAVPLPRAASVACRSQAANEAKDATTSARARVRTQTFLLSMVPTSYVVHAWRRRRADEFTANCELSVKYHLWQNALLLRMD
jgi:hypothetical protein